MTSYTYSTCKRNFNHHSSLRNYIKIHDDKLNDHKPIEIELSDSEQQNKQLLLGAEEEVREEVVEIEEVLEDKEKEEDKGEEEENGEEKSKEVINDNEIDHLLLHVEPILIIKSIDISSTTTNKPEFLSEEFGEFIELIIK
ncbi:hypothetical protein C1646_756658 [Rhizophagus diaphanus]|nr:hypothetical protein C1646_756658 [Rhizophagus diaphanus] [Rhizophagus sp. MUCL 43196]